MKGYIIITLMAAFFVLPKQAYAQDIIKIEAIEPSGKKTVVSIAWPDFEGPMPPDEASKLVANINEELSSEGVDCPQQRTYLGDRTWMCGDGTTIKTADDRMSVFLKEHWGKQK